MKWNRLQLSTASPAWTAINRYYLFVEFSTCFYNSRTMSEDQKTSITALKVKPWTKIVCTFWGTLLNTSGLPLQLCWLWCIASWIQQVNKSCGASLHHLNISHFVWREMAASTKRNCEANELSNWQFPLPSFQQSSIPVPLDWWYWLMPHCILLIKYTSSVVVIIPTLKSNCRSGSESPLFPFLVSGQKFLKSMIQ